MYLLAQELANLKNREAVLMLILLILNNIQYLLRLYEYLLTGCDLKEWSWSEFHLEHERVTPAGGFLWVAP
jgi:hypothetical protein